MRYLVLALAVLTLIPAAAQDDARPVIQSQLQEMMDAIVPGRADVWDRYLDPACIYVEEDDTIKSKVDMLKELTPLPKGIGGTIKVEVLRFHQDGPVAVALVREHEQENDFGQTLYPTEYLSNTVWRRETGGWKLIAGQVLAEQIDPASVKLPLARLRSYTGRYQLKDSDVAYQVTFDGGQQVGGRVGRKPSVLHAEIGDVFFIAGQPRIRKIFTRSPTGRITGFVDRREGRDIVWEKKS